MPLLLENGQESVDMELNQGQTRGIVAIIIGFAITTIVGIVLSFFAVERLPSSQVLLIAIITFIITVPIFGYGIYTYARSTEADVYATNTDMEKPRLLLDILREQGQGDVRLLAEQLNTSPNDIRDYIDDLSRLQLFSGIADWETGLIALADSSVIQAIDTCRNCQNPIQISNNVTVCPNCGTHYYQNY
ncbi:MAG: hypothetical protein AAF846_03720 [Chloroflexota bacterium]